MKFKVTLWQLHLNNFAYVRKLVVFVYQYCITFSISLFVDFA